MRSYSYRARDPKGKIIRGEVSATDAKAARKKIAADGLLALQVTEAKLDPVKMVKNFWRDLTEKKLTTEDMIIFNRQLQIIYSVGIPIMQGLDMVHDQTANPTLKKALGQINQDIAEGWSLSEAMEKHTRVFDEVYVNLIRVGEATGELETMLERCSALIEQRAEQRQKVKSALFYPKLVLSFLGIVLLVVVYGVLPRLKTFFDGFGSNLPFITRVVMGTSDFFVAYWYLVAAIAGGIYWGSKTILSIPRFRYQLDAFLLKIPVAGVLILQIDVNTFCTIFDILLRSGVSILDAFGHVEGTVTNRVIANDIMACRNKIEKGGTLASGLREAKAFPTMVTSLISMGEEGGSLPKVLTQVASYYKIQIDHRLGNLSKLIEPILLFFIFGVVLVIALAVFMPMWSMSGNIKK